MDYRKHAEKSIADCGAAIMLATKKLFRDLESDPEMLEIYTKKRLLKFIRPGILAARSRLTSLERQELAQVSKLTDVNWTNYLRDDGRKRKDRVKNEI